MKYRKVQLTFLTLACSLLIPATPLPGFSQVSPQAAAAYDNGQAPYKQKQYQQAIAAFQKAIAASQPSSTSLPSMYYYIGSCFLQLKNNAQARQYFTFVRDHFPASREAALAVSIVGKGAETASASTSASSSSSSAPASTGNKAAPAGSASMVGAVSTSGSRSLSSLSDLPDENRFYFKQGSGGHMEVQAYLNDKPILCWFDTGASAHFGMNNLRDAGIPTPTGPAKSEVSGWAGKSVPAWEMPCRMRLGNMTRKVMVTIEEELKMPPLLGQDFLEGYTYVLGVFGFFVAMKKTLTSGVASNNLYDLPCTHTGDRDYVTIQVNGRDFNIMIDTGAARTIFDPTALSQIGIQVPEDLPTIPMSGVGGAISMRETTLQIRMGPINRTIPALIGRAGGGSAVGQDVLSENRFTIDSKRHLLRFFH